MPSPTFRKWAWLGPLLTCKNVALLESMSMLSMSILSIDIDNIDTKGPSDTRSQTAETHAPLSFPLIRAPVGHFTSTQTQTHSLTQVLSPNQRPTRLCLVGGDCFHLTFKKK